MTGQTLSTCTYTDTIRAIDVAEVILLSFYNSLAWPLEHARHDHSTIITLDGRSAPLPLQHMSSCQFEIHERVLPL